MTDFDGFFFEVLQKSRNPRWRTKMAAAQNDDVISTSCDVINSFLRTSKEPVFDVLFTSYVSLS